MPAFRICATLAVALLNSCATERALFRPREKVLAESPDGHPAALYALDDEGKSVGEVRIWSAGSWREDNDAQRTVIHLGLEVENRTGGQLTVDVDATDLRQVTAGGRDLAQVERLDVRGSPEIGDGSVGSVEFLFGLPAGNDPTDLDGFQAHWLLRGLHERDFEQLTPFRRDYSVAEERTRWHGGFGFAYGWPYWGYPYPYYWHRSRRCYW